MTCNRGGASAVRAFTPPGGSCELRGAGLIAEVLPAMLGTEDATRAGGRGLSIGAGMAAGLAPRGRGRVN